MEKLQIQKHGSVAQEFVEIDDSFDTEFKQGLYKQNEAFLANSSDTLCHLSQHNKHAKLYAKMAGYQ